MESSNKEDLLSSTQVFVSGTHSEGKQPKTHTQWRGLQTPEGGKSRLQNFKPHVFLDLNLAGRQGCTAEKQRARAPGRTQKQKPSGKKRRQLGHSGPTSLEETALPAQGAGQKGRAALCYWKSWQETKTAQRREKDRGSGRLWVDQWRPHVASSQ